MFSKALEMLSVDEGHAGCQHLGSLKCKPHFLRLIVQKKSRVLQISPQNSAIVQHC